MTFIENINSNLIKFVYSNSLKREKIFKLLKRTFKTQIQVNLADDVSHHIKNH